MLDLFTLTLFPLLMAFAAMSDILTMTIANRVSILLVLFFFVLAALVGVPTREIALGHLACGASVLILTFAFFAFGWIGGGDAKLAAATAVWLGWGHLLEYGLIASLAGAGLTALILQFRKYVIPPVLDGQAWLVRLHNKNNGVPYGVALAAAGLLIYPQTQVWQAAVAL